MGRLEELSQDVAELNRLSGLATRTKVKDILLIETRKLETEIIRLKEVEASNPNNSNVSSSAKSNVNRCYTVQLTNYAWDQSEKFVKIYVDLSGIQDLPSENTSCDFSERAMTLFVKELNNRNYSLTINNLLHPVVSSSSHFKIKKDKAIVFLKKAQENKTWSSLNGSEQDVKKPPAMDPNVDPSESWMDMMKKMYDEGNDDMKRSIAKAWTESREKENKLF